MQQAEYRQVDLLASATADLMTIDATTGFESQLHTAPADGIYEMRIIGSTVAVQVQIFCGPVSVVPVSPVPGGGTIGVFPNENNTIPIQWACLAGDLVSVQLRETAAATASVMATVEFVAQ